MDERLFVSMNMFTCVCVCACVRTCVRAYVYVCVLAIKVCARQYTYMNKLNDVHISVRLDYHKYQYKFTCR